MELLLTCAILSTVAILPTIWVLVRCLDDKSLREQAGINGEMAALAKHAVRRECCRISKHVLLTFGIWMYFLGHPQPWVGFTVSFILAATSIHELLFRQKLERYIQMKAANARAATALSPAPTVTSQP